MNGSKQAEGSRRTGTSERVLQYYEANWRQIADCYAVGEDGIPKDPAYYRREIYLKILRETGADDIVDVGCGGGQTVLDALLLGRQARGVEPVAPLVEAARQLLSRNGQDPKKIHPGDLAELGRWEPASCGTIALLSVLPHVNRALWDPTHRDISRSLKRGGYFIAAYRNDLFDLYTFNSFTVDFFQNSLWDCAAGQPLRRETVVSELKKLMANPDIPGPEATAAKDKSFGTLTREYANPLEMPSYLARFGLKVVRTYFYNYFGVPPLMQDKVKDYRKICHQMDMTMSEDWRGHFMASTFVVVARKET